MPPKEMDAVLENLPLRIGAYVPDDLLEDWFAPGTGMKPVSAWALDAPRARAKASGSCKCLMFTLQISPKKAGATTPLQRPRRLDPPNIPVRNAL